jgi:hypothetical protein
MKKSTKMTASGGVAAKMKTAARAAAAASTNQAQACGKTV